MKQPTADRLSRRTVLVVFLITGMLACLVWAGRVAAKPLQDGSPKTFNTPSQAVDALIKAASSDDVAALIEILGTEGTDIVSTGDQVTDRNGRAEFTRRAKEKKTLLRDRLNANRSILYLGADEWPLPIPIVKQGAKWRFDAAAARTEILARRIGGNESAGIEVCLGFVEAQQGTPRMYTMARDLTSMRSESSARPANTTDCTGRMTTAARVVQSATWLPKRSRRVTRTRPNPIMVIFSGC